MTTADTREIANFFELQPDHKSYGGTHRSARGWWYHHGSWQPRPVTDNEISIWLLKWLITEFDFETACSMIQKTQIAMDDGTAEVLQEAIGEAALTAIRLKTGGSHAG